MNEAVIGIGSNINPHKNIELSIGYLSRQLEIIRQSPIVQTKPWGMKDCSEFQNTALLVRTALPQEELQTLLKEIEQDLGRPLNHDKNAPRTIDLDIVVFNQVIVDQDVYERPFLRQAVQDLTPEVL